MKAVIFDVDGTLVNSYGFDGQCYRQAVRDTLGDIYLRNDWGDYSEVTDEGILREICSDNALTFKSSDAVKSGFEKNVRNYLSSNPSSCAEIAGARDLLRTLGKAKNLRIGIATGGWSCTARMKLDHAGFDHANVPLASCDDSMARINIMDLCREKLECSASDTTYIGDGEWDMRASKELGWKFIGIGPRLEGKCSRWFEDFSSHDIHGVIND